MLERFDLSVADRRVKDQLVEVIASSKKAPLGELLAALSRDRLRELCRALELDDGGKEKALVDRLLGVKAEPTLRALFLKRLSDRFDEECEALIKEASWIGCTRTTCCARCDA